MKLKPMKFKQNGVSDEPQKKNKENLGFFFSTFEAQVHTKVSARTYTWVMWIKYRFSCLMTLYWLHQNNHRPQVEFISSSFQKRKRKELAQVSSNVVSPTIIFNLISVKTLRESTIFYFGLNYLSATHFRSLVQADAYIR